MSKVFKILDLRTGDYLSPDSHFDLPSYQKRVPYTYNQAFETREDAEECLDKYIKYANYIDRIWTVIDRGLTDITYLTVKEYFEIIEVDDV